MGKLAKHGDSLLSIVDVCNFLGGRSLPTDRSTIYRWIRNGQFPKPVRIGNRFSRWLESDLERFLQKAIDERPKLPEIKKPSSKRKAA